MSKNTINKLIDFMNKIFKYNGLAGIIIIVFLSLYIYQVFLTHEMVNKLENIVILNEYRITLLEDEIIKK